MVGCLQGVQWCPCVTFWSFHYRCTNTLVLFFGVFTSRKKCHPQQQQKSLPNRYKNPKKHPTKNEKKTQDITMSPLIFSHYFSSNPTHQLHTQKNTLPGRGSYHASLLGWSWGCSDFPGAQSMATICVFSLGKKDGTSGTWEPTYGCFLKWWYPKNELVGGFNDFLFSSLFGEDEPILTSIFFRWVGSTTNQWSLFSCRLLFSWNIGN